MAKRTNQPSKPGKTRLRLDRRPKKKRLIITLPPLPKGGEIELIQGDNRKTDDMAYAPIGTKVIRP